MANNNNDINSNSKKNGAAAKVEHFFVERDPATGPGSRQGYPLDRAVFVFAVRY